MRIQLKQHEIEAALKGYLGDQGIAVTGKEVTMNFTAGRKNKGISVEVVVEDAVKPSMAEQCEPTAYEHSVLESQEPTEPGPDETVPAEETKSTTTSLFG